MELTDKLTITVQGSTAKWLRQYKTKVETVTITRVGRSRAIRWPEVMETLQMEFEQLQEHCKSEGIRDGCS